MIFRNSVFYLLLIFCLASSFEGFAQYYTGQRVFSSKFPSEKKDYSQDTYVKIENSSGDIIVAIEDVRLGKTIQHAYILSYDSYEFKNIPVGKYYCKYMWTDPLTGKRLFQKDNSLMEFKVDEYGGYVITLESTTNGNLTQSSIDENEFFD
jgi:hypothetical protein